LGLARFQGDAKLQTLAIGALSGFENVGERISHIKANVFVFQVEKGGNDEVVEIEIVVLFGGISS
jgi:hypothetical protein